MKSIRLIIALLTLTTLFISCTNTGNDEELQLLIDNQKILAEDTGGEDNPPVEPPK